MSTVPQRSAEPLRGVRRGPAGFARLGPPAMCLPRTVVRNSEVAERLGVEEDWIERRTGVRERRRAEPDERLSDLAAEAGRRALARASLAPEDLDLVLVATCTADELTPAAAPLVAAALGAPQAGAIDLGAACAGFIAGIDLAAGAIESGRVEHALVIGADFMSRITDRDDRRTAGLMADGVGAITVSGGHPEIAIGPIVLHTDPVGPPLVYALHDDRVLHMDGPSVFVSAVDRISEVTLEALEHAEVELDAVDLFVYHQGNARILSAVGKRLGLDPDKVVVCVDRLGNTSAASIPLGLCVAEEEGRLAPGATVLFGAIGAGFTYGAFVARWGDA